MTVSPKVLPANDSSGLHSSNWWWKICFVPKKDFISSHLIRANSIFCCTDGLWDSEVKVQPKCLHQRLWCPMWVSVPGTDLARPRWDKYLLLLPDWTKIIRSIRSGSRGERCCFCAVQYYKDIVKYLHTTHAKASVRGYCLKNTLNIQEPMQKIISKVGFSSWSGCLAEAFVSRWLVCKCAFTEGTPETGTCFF